MRQLTPHCLLFHPLNSSIDETYKVSENVSAAASKAVQVAAEQAAKAKSFLGSLF
jgi:hypothetical protein